MIFSETAELFETLLLCASSQQGKSTKAEWVAPMHLRRLIIEWRDASKSSAVSEYELSSSHICTIIVFIHF